MHWSAADDFIASNDAPTIHTRYVMGLKNTMAFLVEREKPSSKTTKDRSSGWSGGALKGKPADFSGTSRGRRAGSVKQSSTTTQKKAQGFFSSFFSASGVFSAGLGNCPDAPTLTEPPPAPTPTVPETWPPEPMLTPTPPARPIGTLMPTLVPTPAQAVSRLRAVAKALIFKPN
jgi:hypothetical protein